MVKVVVLGAAGGIGQPLSLLLKADVLISELALYDIVNSPGVAADLSHINTPSKVTGYMGDDQLPAALKDATIIIIPAGVPRKPGMTRDDLFNINAGIVQKLATGIAQHAPNAFIGVISNPVNSTVPIVAEVMKSFGVFNPKRLFGITSLDIVRASTFVSEITGSDPTSTPIEVIGGHSGVTILPILSGSGVEFTDEQRDALTKRIQYGGDEVVQAKAGAGSATLSMAFAGHRFAHSLLRAVVAGESGVKECAFVYSEAAKEFGLDYFSTYVVLGKEGVAEIQGIPQMSEYEQKLFEEAVPVLKDNISKGVQFVNKAAANL